jgi:hypothetical protein
MPERDRYKEALALVESAKFVMDGCNCQSCVVERARDARTQAFAIIYPELKFIPEGLDHFCYNDGIQQFQFYVNLRKRNKQKRDNNQDKRLVYCRYCGKLHRIAHTEKRNDKRYCYDCLDEIFFCSHCNDIYPRDDAYRAIDDNGDDALICYTCHDEYYVDCHACGYSVKAENVMKFPKRRDQRGNIVYNQYCRACIGDNLITCDSCGDETHSRIAYKSAVAQICPACAEMEQGLNQHTFKPLKLRWMRDPHEGTVSDKAFHMGFELECAQYSSFVSVDAMCHLTKDKIGKEYVYCVHDGTIERGCGRPGMEVVTHPFTWQDYKKRGADRWDDLCLYLRKKGWKANLKGIGYHVHTTKAAWGTHQIYKLLKLIYKNQKFVIKIAQREPNDYCVMSEKDFNEAVLVAKDKKNRESHHYNAINLNYGNGASANTIEFRMFQGTLEPLYIHKNIEFVKACYDFTREHTATDMTKDKFVNFVWKNKRSYPCLYEFIKMEGI